MGATAKLDRRDFVRLGVLAGSGLLLGVYVPGSRANGQNSHAPFQPNVFVRLDANGDVSIWVHKVEMGQGVRTSLPMIVADEMDADWSRVKVVQADAHPDKYGRMMTVGSSSVRNGAWMPLRTAGAAAREMLVAAAAEKWGVSAAECRTENGRVHHSPTGRSFGYGELADAAAQLPVPERPRLKEPGEFRLIGTRVPQVDVKDKSTGRATFGLDVRIPDMLYATVVHPPVFGGKLRSFDAARALAVPGVRQVIGISTGVAVVATNTWAAFQGAKALDIEWDNGSFNLSSPAIARLYADLAERPGAEAAARGDITAGLAGAARRLEAVYEAPYLAHATMEPMNCTVRVHGGRCEIWAPTQNPQGTQSTAAQITGLPIDAVTVHPTYLGCGWGRRSRMDFVQDAVETAMKANAPIQLTWTREEDMQHDFYRPATYQTLEAGLDASGRLVALRARVIAGAISGGRGGVDSQAVDGIANLKYGVPNLYVDYARPDVPVPVGFWRSVGPSQNTFVLETFIDELAHAANRDPFEFRRELLANEPRLRRVLEVAAEKSGWGTPLPQGRARGIALVENKGGLVAEVAEVSLENGRIRVHRVTCTADCGRIIHPGIVEAQMVGSIVCGLSAALYGEITIENGRVKQSNFHDYPMLRINEMPQVDLHLIPSEEEPGGVGEPAVPPVAPAVANALFMLTGRRARRLPLRGEGAETVGGAR